MVLTFQGKVWKDSRYWLIEIPALDVMTEGYSRADALDMLKDAVESLIDRSGFEADVALLSDNVVVLRSRKPASERILAGFFLKQQRAKHGLTLNDMAKRLHLKSRNAYAQFEQGRSFPSLCKIQEFISAMNPHAMLAVNVIEERKHISTQRRKTHEQ